MTDVLVSRELLPCPFCGAIVTMGKNREGAKTHYWQVECDECGAIAGSAYTTEESAAKNWNRRAALDAKPVEPVALVPFTDSQILALANTIPCPSAFDWDDESVISFAKLLLSVAPAAPNIANDLDKAQKRIAELEAENTNLKQKIKASGRHKLREQVVALTAENAALAKLREPT